VGGEVTGTEEGTLSGLAEKSAGKGRLTASRFEQLRDEQIKKSHPGEESNHISDSLSSGRYGGSGKEADASCEERVKRTDDLSGLKGE